MIRWLGLALAMVPGVATAQAYQCNVPDATMLLEDRGQFLPFEFLPEPARHDQHVGLPVERKPLDVVEVGHLSQVIAASMDRRRSASEWAALPPF